jgi:hypothetical protein
MLNTADFVTVTTDYIKNFYHKHYNVPYENIIAIPNLLPRFWFDDKYDVDKKVEQFKKNKAFVVSTSLTVDNSKIVARNILFASWRFCAVFLSQSIETPEYSVITERSACEDRFSICTSPTLINGKSFISSFGSILQYTGTLFAKYSMKFAL